MVETTIQFMPETVADMDERLEIILREFELSIRWQRPCILFAVYSSEYVRADIQNELENYLFDYGQKIVNIRVKERQNQDLIQIIDKHEPSAKHIFIIEGLRWGLDEHENLYEALNNQHDYFSENNIRLLFWLTQNEIISLARYAPDLWGQRHQVVEFSESPKGGYVLQQKLESEWQGTGEYDGQFDDTDEKISMRETMLTDIPQEVESSSIRANLLLTLGILHWRKGDFEKADQLLDEAMNLAIKIEDNWFEAECLNARALVYTSLERIDEAIDSYKQAIHLLPGQIFAWNNLGNLCA
ncbi:MAG: tetratricopeptide repeat protein, partial [Legionella sp.]|nr:tetratricopeptide repeat protein [Legionella sp.]